MIPVVIFAYNRLGCLTQTWRSLTNCSGFEGRDIFIFQDGLKEGGESEKWNVVNAFLKEISQLHQVQLITRNDNLGLAVSVHSGISEVLTNFETVIVLEDDLILAKDFLEFMDSALSVYKDRKDIYSISGFSHFKNHEIQQDVFVYQRPNSWGWATWREKWTGFELDAIPRSVLDDYSLLKEFQKGGVDLPWMLRNQFRGKINSWAIQWSFYQFKSKGFSVSPRWSKVENIGFGEDATHTKKLGNVTGKLCDSKLILNASIVEDITITKKYRAYYRLGLISRCLNKIWLSFLKWFFPFI
jgi:GR25 family glycosyltransferase involved in LPS biosynthesis